MRNVLWAVLPAVVLSVAAPAQSPEWADKLFAPGGASHDFGIVSRGELLRHSFSMTNIFAVPLEITGTRVSCGCTTVTPRFTRLSAKETGAIEVTMDARRFTGAKAVNVYVTVGPQFTSTATLTVSANSRAEVVCNPAQADFGVVPADQTRTQTIDVDYVGTRDWRILGVADPQPPLDVKFREKYRKPGQVGYQLEVSLKGSAVPGPFKYAVHLRTNDPSGPLLPMLVEGSVQAAVSAFPARLPMGGVKVGQPVQQRVLVTGTGDKPFRIVRVDGQGDGLIVEVPAAPAAVQVVTVKWRPNAPGKFQRALRVSTDLDGGATTTITVEGDGVR